MPIGTAQYGPEELPPSHWDAIFTAVDLLTDQFFDDVATLIEDKPFRETTMADYLPRRYLSRYTTLFAKQFLTCLITVTWKLQAPGCHHLACTAEELALNALIGSAEEILESRGEPPDFRELRDVAFEDADLELLFDPAQDGIEDTATGRALGLDRLGYEHWFKPFRDDEPVHPYVAASPI